MTFPLPDPGRARVLLVDDERTNLQVLNALLKHDYEIMVATSGAQALALARAHPPDLVLLDVLMPAMDGYEVCRQMRSDAACAHIPVIFITALAQSSDEAFGLDQGAVDYITKPFSPAVVQARVRTHVRLKRQNDLLAQLVMLDALTGVANRRGWEQACEREWARCRRNGHSLAVALVDVDHFKLYNDHHGHGAGDVCLVRVAQALLSSLRRGGDVLARYGGEEFAVLLPHTQREDALKQAQRMCQCVEELEIAHGHSSASPWVTISVGVAWCEQIGTMHSMAQLCEQADTALYGAKSAGRNQALLHEPAAACG